MADLSQFTGSTPAVAGRHVDQIFTDETGYEKYVYNNTGTPDSGNPLYDVNFIIENFPGTLFYIEEDE